MKRVLLESLAFDRPVATANGGGGSRMGWEERHLCRGRFLYLRGGEHVLQSRLEGRQPVVVTIRSSLAAREIAPDWRLRDLHAGEVYNIRSIVPTEDRLYLELTCERGVAT